MERLRELGVRNFGYFPDNFAGNQAEIQTMDTGTSLRTAPAK
jgi:hypothetical protein